MVIPGLCRTPERGWRPSQIPTTHVVEKGRGCGSPRFCLNPPLGLSLGAGFPTPMLFLFTGQDFLPPPGPNPSSTLRRETVKWYSHCSPNQSPSTPGGQRAASGRGTWVVCGSRVRGEMETDTDFPLILPRSTFSFCAKLICRCLLKLNIRRLRLGVRPDQTLTGPGGQWCLGPSSSGYTILLVFTCMGSKESGVPISVLTPAGSQSG